MKRIAIFIVFVFIFGVFAFCAESDSSVSNTNNDGNIPFTAVYKGLGNYNAYAGNGQIYVAVGDGGRVDISKDLQSWNEVKRFTYEDLTHITYTGEKFIAFCDTSYGRNLLRKDHKMKIYVSENGIDWNELWPDVPQNIKGWDSVSFTEGEFIFIDFANSCYYMTMDFMEWNKVPFYSKITDHRVRSIKKVNGRYILLEEIYGYPIVSKILEFSTEKGWVEKSSFTGMMETLEDVTYFNGSYYAFSCFREIHQVSTQLFVYISKDLQTWKKTNIIDDFKGSAGDSIRSLVFDGKVHLMCFGGWSYIVEIVSTDGENWTLGRNNIPIRDNSIGLDIVGDYGVKFFAVNNNIIAVYGNYILASTGSNDWNTLKMPSYTTGPIDIFNNDRNFILQDSFGKIYTTRNGLRWKK